MECDVFTGNGRRVELILAIDSSIKDKKGNREKASLAIARLRARTYLYVQMCISYVYIRLREQKPGEQIACTDPIKVLLSLARS